MKIHPKSKSPDPPIFGPPDIRNFSEMKVTRRLRRKRKSGFGRSNGNEVTSGFDRHRLATSESESGSDQKSDDEQDSRPNKRDNRRESARK